VAVLRLRTITVLTFAAAAAVTAVAGNARPMSLGGGTWNDAALQRTDPSVVTGSRTASGTNPLGNFLRPRRGAAIGASL